MLRENLRPAGTRPTPDTSPRSWLSRWFAEINGSRRNIPHCCRARLTVEWLEGRWVPSGTIDYFNGIDSGMITGGADGYLYYNNNLGSEVDTMDTSGNPGTVYVYYEATGNIYGVARGADDNVWMTGLVGEGPLVNVVGYIDHLTHDTVFYPLPDGWSAYPGIAPVWGSDGDVWFGVNRSDLGSELDKGIANMDPYTGEVLGYYSIPSETVIGRLTPGPDDNLWFTEPYTGKIGKITTGGTITEYAIPNGGNPSYEATPGAITAAPDGNLWFTYKDGVGSITPSGSFTLYTVEGGNPSGIAASDDGYIYYGVNAPQDGPITIVQRSLETGVTDETRSSINTLVVDLTIGPDGNVWISAPSVIMRYTPPSGGGFAAPAAMPPSGSGPAADTSTAVDGVVPVGGQTVAPPVVEAGRTGVSARATDVTLTAPLIAPATDSGGLTRAPGAHHAQFTTPDWFLDGRDDLDRPDDFAPISVGAVTF